MSFLNVPKHMSGVPMSNMLVKKLLKITSVACIVEQYSSSSTQAVHYRLRSAL